MSESQVFESVKRGDLETTIQHLDEEPELVYVQDEDGATLLHYAALNGHRTMVRMLIERGAAPNSFDATFGATPAGWAIEHFRELGGLLAIEIDDLVYAIEQQDSKWVKRLTQRFPNLINQVATNGITLRELANQSENPEIIELFNQDLQEP
ncbi:MAG: ankyrin repeat domain-containing protein [Planctomycetota bacterium]